MTMTMWYPWRVCGYYADTVKPPKVPGDLAIEVGGVSEAALAADVEVLRQREDIGRILGPFCVDRPRYVAPAEQHD